MNQENRIFRLWSRLRAYYRSRSTLWWLMVFSLYMLYRVLRLTIFSDFANEEWNRIHDAPPPTREQMRKMLDLKH